MVAEPLESEKDPFAAIESRLAEAAQSIRKEGVQGSLFLRRRLARLAAVQFIYETEITKIPPKTLAETFLTQNIGLVEAYDVSAAEKYPRIDEDWFRMLVNMYALHTEGVRNLVKVVLERGGRSFWRVESLLLSIILAASCEIIVAKDISAAVILNEYLDLSRDFYFGNEYRIVNGVLDRIVKETSAAGASHS